MRNPQSGTIQATLSGADSDPVLRKLDATLRFFQEEDARKEKENAERFGAISEDQRRSLLDYIEELRFEQRILGFRAQPTSRPPATPAQASAHDAMMEAGKEGLLAAIVEILMERDAEVRVAEHRLVKVKESCARVGIEPPGEVIESYVDVLRRRRPAQAPTVRR